MQSQTAKIALAVVISTIVVGGGVYLWKTSQQANQEISSTQLEYVFESGDSFTAELPSSYRQSAAKTGTITIFGPNGKIMIGDFEPAAGPVPTYDMNQEQTDEVPKDISYHGYEGKIASALFYKTGDEKTMQELKKIQNSIKLK